MTDPFTKILTPYKDSNGKQIQGKYHFKLPDGMEPECYPMEIEYESTDVNKPDAYQYNGYIVIGHRAYIRTSPIIIPFNTTATEEEDITVEEKMNTAFSAVIEAFKEDDFTDGVNTLPFHIHFVKGQFKDYHKDPDKLESNLNSDFSKGYVSPTISLPVVTNDNGKNTTNIKVSDIYKSTETINDLNTIIFKCKGTLNRGNDNYVPNIIEAPLIIGTTHVYVRNTPFNTRTLTIENTAKTVATTSGRGKLEFDCDVLYEFARNGATDNYTMKAGYDSYRTDRNKYVKVGKIYLEYYDDSSEQWVIIPKSELTAVDNTTTIESDGAIVQTSGKENGGVKVYWTNNFQYNTKKNIKYRWKYEGKAGATYGFWSGAYWLALDPSYGTPNPYTTRVIMNETSYEGSPNSDIQICGKLQQKTGGNWIDATEGQGTVTLTFQDGHSETATVNGNGSFCVTVNKESGSYPVTISFHDNKGLYNDASTTTTIKIESKITEITLNQEPLTIIRGATGVLKGKVVTKAGTTQVDMLNGVGSVTLDNTTTVQVNSKGEFTFNIPARGSGTYNHTLKYHDSTQRYLDSTKTTTTQVEYDYVVNVDEKDLTLKNGDNAVFTGHVSVVEHNDSYTDQPITTWKGKVGGVQINANGTFSVTKNYETEWANKRTEFYLVYVPPYGASIMSPVCSMTYKKVNVNIKSSKSRVIVYDNKEVDGYTSYRLTVTDELGNPARSGKIKVYLKPTFWMLANKSPMYIREYTVPSTGVLELNAYDLLTDDFVNYFDSRNILKYYEYLLSADYISTETSVYNSAIGKDIELPKSTDPTKPDPTTFKYHYIVKQAKLKVDISSKQNGIYTSIKSVTIDDFDPSENSGNLSSYFGTLTVPSNDIKITLSILDSNNHLIDGVGYQKWLTCSNDIPVYQQNPDTWEYILDGYGNKKLSDIHRYIKKNVPETDDEGIIHYVLQEIQTPVWENPCYTGIPLQDKTIFLTDEPFEQTSGTTQNVIKFTIPEEATGTSTFYIGLSHNAGYVLKGVSNKLVQKSLSLEYGLDSNHQYVTEIKEPPVGFYMNIGLKKSSS